MAIQNRRGLKKDFDPNKLLPAEYAIPTDTKEVFVAFAPGDVKRMATWDDFNAEMGAVAEATERANTASEYAESLIVNKAGINDLNPTLTEAYSGAKVEELIAGIEPSGDSSDSTVTFTESEEDVDIVSGDTHATLFGKLLKTIKTLKYNIGVLATDKIDKTSIIQTDIVNDPTKVPSSVVTNALGKEIDTITNNLDKKVSKVNNVLPDANGNVIIDVPEIDASNLATKTELQAVSSGSPRGVFATLEDLQVAFPTGTTGIYIVSEDGNWYYWNNSAWTAGGAYQSTGIADESVTNNKRTASGDYAHVSLKAGAVDFDLVNKVIKFPNTTSGMVFWRNKRIDIPANLQVAIDERYGYSALMLNTKTSEFKTFRYGLMDGSSVGEEWVILASINSNDVTCDFPYTVNGKFPVYKRNRLEFINTGKVMFEHYPNTLRIVKNNRDIEVQITTSLWIYPHETTENLYFIQRSGASNYTLPSGSYDETAKIFKFVLPHSYTLISNWLDKTVRIGRYTSFKNGDLILASCMEGELLSGVFRDILTNQQLTQIGDELFNYSKPYIDDETRIKSVAHSKKKGLLRFAFMTDVHDHLVYKRDYKFSILNKLAKTKTLDFIATGGDLLGYDTKDEVLQKLMDYNKMVTNGITVPYFFCKGNHDSTGNIYSSDNATNILSDMEWFNVGCKGIDGAVYDDDNIYGGYYYRDFDNAKIRVITLNTSQINGLDQYIDPMNVLIQQSQIDWLQNKALNFTNKPDKEKWGVIILSHAAINYAESGGLNGQQVIEGILKAFMTGGAYTETQGTGINKVNASIDYTSQGKIEFICAINGHMHYDRVTTFATLNRPNISVGSAVSDTYTPEHPDATKPDRLSGTITGELLNLFSIDTENRKILVTRYGAGVDKEIGY